MTTRLDTGRQHVCWSAHHHMYQCLYVARPGNEIGRASSVYHQVPQDARPVHTHTIVDDAYTHTSTPSHTINLTFTVRAGRVYI